MMLYKLTTMDRIILYHDTFSLSEVSSFEDFIQTLENENFSPYRLLIDKIPLSETYHLEFQPTIIPLLDRPLLADWKFMDECTLNYSGDEKAVVLKASISTSWLIFYLVFLLSFIYASITIGVPILLFLPILFFIVFFFGLYKCDLQRFDKIRSLAKKNNTAT